MRTKLDYDGIICGAARPSYFKKLKTIHHQGLKLTLGPSISLQGRVYFEANESPLSLRRQKLALQYDTKLSSRPSNPTYDSVFKTHYKTFFEEKFNTIKPFIIFIGKLTSEMEINSSHMYQTVISKLPPSQLKQPDFILDLTKCSKNRTNLIASHEEFQNIKDLHSDYKYTYKDRSKNKHAVGSAATYDI